VDNAEGTQRGRLTDSFVAFNRCFPCLHTTTYNTYTTAGDITLMPPAVAAFACTRARRIFLGKTYSSSAPPGPCGGGWLCSIAS